MTAGDWIFGGCFFAVAALFCLTLLGFDVYQRRGNPFMPGPDFTAYTSRFWVALLSWAAWGAWGCFTMAYGRPMDLVGVAMSLIAWMQLAGAVQIAWMCAKEWLGITKHRYVYGATILPGERHVRLIVDDQRPTVGEQRRILMWQLAALAAGILVLLIISR